MVIFGPRAQILYMTSWLLLANIAHRILVRLRILACSLLVPSAPRHDRGMCYAAVFGLTLFFRSKRPR